MKKNILKGIVLIGIAVLSSCSTYTVGSFQSDQPNGTACPSPTYIATMSKTANLVFSDDGTSTPVLNQKSMNLVVLLQDARNKYGDDVTIQNVRWDIANGHERTGVIYDVIRCK